MDAILTILSYLFVAFWGIGIGMAARRDARLKHPWFFYFVLGGLCLALLSEIALAIARQMLP